MSDGPVAALFAGELRSDPRRSLLAVKVLHSARVGASSDPPCPTPSADLRRIRDDGGRLARLDHGNIVCVKDVVRIDGAPALVSPWVEGIDLLDWLDILGAQGTRLPGRLVCETLRSVAVALDAALNRVPWSADTPLGLLHLDVKPANVMVSREGQIKVLDFGSGLSSLAGDRALELARRAGVDRYLCPDRRHGGPATPASDVYALGLMGIELCRGEWLRRSPARNPDHDRYLAEIVANHEDPGMRSEADERTLRALLLRMVAHDAEARPPAVEVAQTLRTLADRATGACLETFAHQHALPHLQMPIPRLGGGPASSPFTPVAAPVALETPPPVPVEASLAAVTVPSPWPWALAGIGIGGILTLAVCGIAGIVTLALW